MDLAASPHRPTGVALLQLGRHRLRCILAREARLSNQEIASLVARAAVVAIDAPLALPTTRGFRRVEREAMRLGARLLPPSLPSMRLLAERALRLAKLLEAYADVLETHPASVRRIAWCRVEALLAGSGCSRGGRHAQDAAVAAAAAALLAAGEAVILPGEVYGFTLPRPGLCPAGRPAHTAREPIYGSNRPAKL